MLDALKALFAISTVPDSYRVFRALVVIWQVPIQKIFVEVEKFSFIQKIQSYSPDVIFSEETCILDSYTCLN